MCRLADVQNISVSQLVKPCVPKIQRSYFEEDSELVYCARPE